MYNQHRFTLKTEIKNMSIAQAREQDLFNNMSKMNRHTVLSPTDYTLIHVRHNPVKDNPFKSY